MLLITDFGHDPDDAIALSYLIEHGIVSETIVLNEKIYTLAGLRNR